MNPLAKLPAAARGLALAATLAGTLPNSPRRDIRKPSPRLDDWAADPARVGHEPGYTWYEPDGLLRCVHCGYRPCSAPAGHRLSPRAAA